ncbi:MAG: universal stress protein [Acidobacteria bacterium]|nr:universal stress protein [Acidobacteriota bacterium]
MSNRMKVLVAYDGSACADAAIAELPRAGLPEEVECMVLSVIENWLPPPSGLEIVQHIDRDQEYMLLAMEAANRLREIAPGWIVKAELSVGAPASQILEKAEQWKPELIVMGAHGRTALGRFFFGSVSQKVLHEARCSVRVAREPEEKSDHPLRLLIGFDGSPGATETLRVVTARKWPADCEARVVYAAWPSVEFASKPLIGKIADWVADEELKIKRKIEGVVRDLSAAGLTTSSVIKAENPKQLLISEAESWKADCIFVGARGLGTLERWRLGSVSSAIAARAHCSVEVVHS